jgi:hypothetical protein
MDTEDLYTKAQKIIDSYKGCPADPIIKESMANEIAYLIVDGLQKENRDIKSFNFESFVDSLNFPDSTGSF